jgi:gentisate 1,2-dioxygenase
VLRIEYRDVEFLDGKVFESLGKELVDVARPPDWRTLLSLLCRHPSPKLQSRVYSNRTSRSYAANAGERGNRLRRQQPQRAAAGRQDFLPNPECGTPLGSTAK